MRLFVFLCAAIGMLSFFALRKMVVTSYHKVNARTLNEHTMIGLHEKALVYRLEAGAFPARIEDITVMPLDAWKNRFKYATHENGARLTSAGPDGVFGTSDDIHRVF